MSGGGATALDALADLVTDCKRRGPREAAAALAERVDETSGVGLLLGRVFQSVARSRVESEGPGGDAGGTGLRPLAETAAALAASADARRLGLGKAVAEAFLGSAGSARCLAAFGEAYERVAAGAAFRLQPEWIARAALSRAAALEGGLDEYLGLLPSKTVRVSDLVRAALKPWSLHGDAPGCEEGWAGAAADPARRALARAAFEDPRASAFEAPRSGSGRGSGLAELMDWGMRARDLGIVSDEALWRFYERYEEGGAADDRERRLREWLVERGSSRVTAALREACVGLAAASRNKM